MKKISSWHNKYNLKFKKIKAKMKMNKKIVKLTYKNFKKKSLIN